MPEHMACCDIFDTLSPPRSHPYHACDTPDFAHALRHPRSSDSCAVLFAIYTSTMLIIITKYVSSLLSSCMLGGRGPDRPAWQGEMSRVVRVFELHAESTSQHAHVCMVDGMHSPLQHAHKSYQAGSDASTLCACH